MRTISKLFVISLAAASLAGCANADAGEETQTIDPVGSQPQAQGGGSGVWQSTWKGANADASFWNETGSGYVSVWENEGSNGAYASLSYSFSSVDPTSWKCSQEYNCYFPPPPPPDPNLPKPPPGDPICEVTEVCRYTRYSWSYGWGEIDAADFRAGGKSAALAADLSQYPSFWAETCTIDTESWNPYPSCTWGAASGTIELNWKGDNKASQFRSGVDRSDFGKYSFQTTGVYRSSSASVSGEAFGTEVNSSGWMSNSNGVSISKGVVLAPKP